MSSIASIQETETGKETVPVLKVPPFVFQETSFLKSVPLRTGTNPTNPPIPGRFGFLVDGIKQARIEGDRSGRFRDFGFDGAGMGCAAR